MCRKWSTYNNYLHYYLMILLILSCQVETLMKRVIAALTHQSVIIEGISCENYKVQLKPLNPIFQVFSIL